MTQRRERSDFEILSNHRRMKTDPLNGIAIWRDRALTFELFNDYPSMMCHGHQDFTNMSSSDEIPDINDGTHINASSAEKSTKASGREKT
jgi:hypothetical protein